MQPQTHRPIIDKESYTGINNPMQPCLSRPTFLAQCGPKRFSVTAAPPYLQPRRDPSPDNGSDDQRGWEFCRSHLLELFLTSPHFHKLALQPWDVSWARRTEVSRIWLVSPVDPRDATRASRERSGFVNISFRVHWSLLAALIDADTARQCDQETPLCGNCRKSNRPCSGYKRRLGYVFSRDVRLASGTDSGHEETTVTHQGRWRRAEPQQPSLSAYPPQRTGAPLSWMERLLSPTLPGHISAKPTMAHQFHCLFLNHYLPPDMLSTHGPKSLLPPSWLLQLRDVEMQSPALKTSTAAFFASRVAQLNNDANLALQCRSLYVDSLKQLQSAVCNPQTRLSDETLAACVALSLYELTGSEGGTASAYMAHMRGAMMLLELRGPDASASPLGHSIFLDLRAQQVSFALTPAWSLESTKQP